MDPNSSPPINTNPPVMPRSADHLAAKHAESDLSVSPISTCFTSLVIRGSVSPAVLEVRLARSTTAARFAIPANASRAFTASARTATSAFLGSVHPSIGMRSILRRLSRSDTTLASRPLAFSRSTVCVAALERAASSSSCNRASEGELWTAGCDLEDLRASITAQVQRPATLRPGMKLIVDVADMGIGHDEHVYTGQAERLDSVAYRTGIGLPVWHSGPVPVEDEHLESLVRDHHPAALALGVGHGQSPEDRRNTRSHPLDRATPPILGLIKPVPIGSMVTSSNQTAPTGESPRLRAP